MNTDEYWKFGSTGTLQFASSSGTVCRRDTTARAAQERFEPRLKMVHHFSLSAVCAALVANVPLVIEDEATCRLAEHRIAAGFNEREVKQFLDAVVAMIEPVETHFLWRPRLRDPADEMALEAAVNGRAAAIVTFNTLDYGKVPNDFGVEVLLPGTY